MSSPTAAVLPAIDTIEQTCNDNPLRGRCVGCGREGVYDFDGELVILHRRECARSEAADD